MKIIGRLKTNKLARQTLLLWEPYEWLFLSWFFWPHIFLWFLTKFSSLCFWNNFHHTLRTLYALFSLNMLLRSVIFENFWLFPQGGVIAVFTCSTSYPSPFPSPSHFPSSPTLLSFLTHSPPPSLTLLLAQTLVSIHEVMFLVSFIYLLMGA